MVQPSVYGADNACTLDAVRRMGARARGVAVIDRTTSRKALEEMAAAGIRGVRLNLETNTAGRFDPADAKAVLDATAEQIRGLGWHVQIYTRTAMIAGLKDHLAQMPFPVVVDHFGRGNPGQGPGQPDFVALLDLVKSGACLREDLRRLPRVREGAGLSGCDRDWRRRWSRPIPTGSCGDPTGPIRTRTPAVGSR